MDNKMKKICTICARGGSKGISGKNIREIAGKPLIAHTILQAKSCGIFDAIAVSSDSARILDISKKYGVSYLIKRPDELSDDKAPKLPAIRHCVEEAEKLAKSAYDIIVDLDATSPLRRIGDIKAVVDL